jgi:hypothetical protein
MAFRRYLRGKAGITAKAPVWHRQSYAHQSETA